MQDPSQHRHFAILPTFHLHDNDSVPANFYATLLVCSELQLVVQSLVGL